MYVLSIIFVHAQRIKLCKRILQIPLYMVYNTYSPCSEWTRSHFFAKLYNKDNKAGTYRFMSVVIGCWTATQPFIGFHFGRGGAYALPGRYEGEM